MEKKKYRKQRLTSSWTYQKFDWYECVLKAKSRLELLERQFDAFSKYSHHDFYKKKLLVINSELELILDYMDWLGFYV